MPGGRELPMESHERLCWTGVGHQSSIGSGGWGGGGGGGGGRSTANLNGYLYLCGVYNTI